MIFCFYSITILYLTLLFAKAGSALIQTRRELLKRPGGMAQPFTILQAILSGDPSLKETLESNLLSMPSQAFIWLVDEDDEAAIAVANTLKSGHPECLIEILKCPVCPPGLNPKLFKLNYGREYVKTEFLIVLDDDTILPPQSADAIIKQAQSHDLVTGLPCYLDSGSFASSLLAQFVNNNSAMTILPPFRSWSLSPLTECAMRCHREIQPASQPSSII